MSTELSADEIDMVLHADIVARIAYVDRRGLPCIVPISYAYDGRALYGYSLSGAKLENMGANPQVCVEIDRIANAADWCSVVVRGTFEQLDGAEAIHAVALIESGMKAAAIAAGAPRIAQRTFVERQSGQGVAYRILVTERHGRRSLAIAR